MSRTLLVLASALGMALAISLGGTVAAADPHPSFLALDVAPGDAFANIQRLRAVPGLYGRYGFFDAVDPRTKAVGHRYLVLDQSMIMAALDNVLRDGAMRDHFVRDPIIQAARPYLAMEGFSLGEH